MIDNLMQKFNNQYNLLSARVDNIVIERLLTYSNNLHNYTAVFYDHSDAGYFMLDDKKVLRWSRGYKSSLDYPDRDYTTTTEFEWTFSYEVYDYITNEYLYIEEEL